MRVRVLLVAVVLAAGSSLAEQAAVNFHLDPMVGSGLDKSKLLTGASLKVDTTLLKFLGPVSPQLEFFGVSASDRTYFDDGSVFGAGIGARVRLLNDEKGYLFNPGQNRTGNAWGNLWVDAHLTIASGGFGPGFDVGLGAEFSLVEGLSVGPFAKFMFFGQRANLDFSPHSTLLFGVSFTIGAPQTTPAEADFDNDGLKGDDDKCVDEAEDTDGFEDTDGCPEKDNDKDGIDDAADQCRDGAEDKDGIQDEDGCPETDADADGVSDETDACKTDKGAAENKGCPDTDKDADGVVDRLDACIDAKGIAENKGCADTDQDADGTVDRLDTCRAEAGPATNKGCPYPDTDKDGVTDNLDNCPSEAGVATNAGCPANKKQLVAITAGSLDLKDKVYFDTGKATIQARSNALLDQLAGILVSHPELAKVQIEGHTDNSGDAAANKSLSAARADAVAAYLVKKGVDASRLVAVGYGAERPVEDNGTPKGREANRRVAFTILAH